MRGACAKRVKLSLILLKISGDIRRLWQRKNSPTASALRRATARMGRFPLVFAGKISPFAWVFFCWW